MNLDGSGYSHARGRGYWQRRLLGCLKDAWIWWPDGWEVWGDRQECHVCCSLIFILFSLLFFETGNFCEHSMDLHLLFLVIG